MSLPFLRRVCLFSVLATVLAVPVVPPKKLLPPYLSLDGTATKKDITEVLDDAKCEYDRELTLCYSKIGVKFLPGIGTPTPTFVNLYNGNIELLWMISHLGWLKDMCEQDVLKDLSSLHFCSNLKSEETFEHELIRIMGKTMSVLQLTEVTDFASSLDRMRGKDECLRVCGGKYNSVLCEMFTELANFIVFQENKLELQNSEKTLNVTAAGSTHTDVSQPDTPSPASPPEQPSTSDQLTGTTSPTSDEEIRTLLHKLALDKLDPQQLKFFLSRVASTNTPSPPTLSTATVITAVKDTDMSVTVSPTTGKENVQSKEVPTVNYSVSDDIGETEFDGTPERAAEPTIVGAGGDDWTLDGDDDKEDDWEEDDGLDHQEDNLILPSEQENGGVADSGQVELTTTEGKVTDIPLPDAKNANQQPNVEGAKSNNAEGQLAGVEAVYNDDEDGSSGSGYRSIHFFGILLVLVAFTVTAYLCVHHKKKIKETMKDYVSEGQKKKRTRGAYKPLLPGNK